MSYIAYDSMYSGVDKKFKAMQAEVRFASFLSSGFITAIVVNPTGEEIGKTHLCAVFYIDFN